MMVGDEWQGNQRLRAMAELAPSTSPRYWRGDPPAKIARALGGAFFDLISYSNREGSDGYFLATAAAEIAGEHELALLASSVLGMKALVHTETDAEGCPCMADGAWRVGYAYRIHNHFKWNPSAAGKRLRDQKRRELRDRSLRWLVYRRDRFTCRYCDPATAVPLNPKNGAGKDLLKRISLDHVDPNGAEADENLVTACLLHQEEKGDHTPDEVGMTLYPAPASPARDYDHARELHLAGPAADHPQTTGRPLVDQPQTTAQTTGSSTGLSGGRTADPPPGPTTGPAAPGQGHRSANTTTDQATDQAARQPADSLGREGVGAPLVPGAGRPGRPPTETRAREHPDPYRRGRVPRNVAAPIVWPDDTTPAATCPTCRAPLGYHARPGDHCTNCGNAPPRSSPLSCSADCGVPLDPIHTTGIHPHCEPERRSP